MKRTCIMRNEHIANPLEYYNGVDTASLETCARTLDQISLIMHKHARTTPAYINFLIVSLTHRSWHFPLAPLESFLPFPRYHAVLSHSWLHTSSPAMTTACRYSTSSGVKHFKVASVPYHLAAFFIENPTNPSVAGFGFANGLFHFWPTQLVLAASRLYGPTDYHSAGYCCLYTNRLDTKNA